MINLKYQIALYGTYGDILPKPDTIKYFIDSFSDKELIPTTWQEISPEGAVNRFSLTSPTESWLIEFGSSRIDIFHTNKDVGVTDFLTLTEFIDTAVEMLNIVNKKFPKKHHRLALVTRTLLGEMSTKEHNRIYQKLNSTIELYKKNDIVDWNSRVVCRENYQISELPEIINVISNVKRTKGNLKFNSKPIEVDRVELNFDINTFQGNTDYRFDSILLQAFLKKATEIENNLKNEYLKLLEYEQPV